MIARQASADYWTIIALAPFGAGLRMRAALVQYVLDSVSNLTSPILAFP